MIYHIHSPSCLGAPLFIHCLFLFQAAVDKSFPKKPSFDMNGHVGTSESRVFVMALVPRRLNSLIAYPSLHIQTRISKLAYPNSHIQIRVSKYKVPAPWKRSIYCNTNDVTVPK